MKEDGFAMALQLLLLTLLYDSKLITAMPQGLCQVHHYCFSTQGIPSVIRT